MNYRYMRTIVLFDLPMETKPEQKQYRKFIKFLKKSGFIMFQKSVYTKLHINNSTLDNQKRLINKNLPSNGIVSILNITEKQFQTIEHLIGQRSSNIIDDDSRYVEL